MVRDGFAIPKVGSGVTFAMREALFGIADVVRDARDVHGVRDARDVRGASRIHMTCITSRAAATPY